MLHNDQKFLTKFSFEIPTLCIHFTILAPGIHVSVSKNIKFVLLGVSLDMFFLIFFFYCWMNVVVLYLCA